MLTPGRALGLAKISSHGPDYLKSENGTTSVTICLNAIMNFCLMTPKKCCLPYIKPQHTNQNLYVGNADWLMNRLIKSSWSLAKINQQARLWNLCSLKCSIFFCGEFHRHLSPAVIRSHKLSNNAAHLENSSVWTHAGTVHDGSPLCSAWKAFFRGNTNQMCMAVITGVFGQCAAVI